MLRQNSSESQYQDTCLSTIPYLFLSYAGRNTHYILKRQITVVL